MLPTDCQEFSNPSDDTARKAHSPDLDTQPETQPMNESLRAQIETYVSHLNGLIGRGRQLGELLAADPSSVSAIGATRVWQEDCGITINQLSGGSKAHWLARSFSQAFLLRSGDGHAMEGVAPAEIVQGLLGVLEQGVASLSQADKGPVISASSEAPPPHRFEFVHNSELRPIVEHAYLDSRSALEQGEYETALLTSCGILEAIVTDALEHKGLSALIASGAPAEKISDWSFETRLAVAERAGLIRGGCARLPAVARAYRDDAEGGGGLKTKVTERDARQTGQVLHVVMRDLDPGR
ncbi:MAG: hypothetical protein WBW38_02405 [Candidatus Sulfotelmatobacter sp.]